jgi:hypothetical protein
MIEWPNFGLTSKNFMYTTFHEFDMDSYVQPFPGFSSQFPRLKKNGGVKV